MIILKYCLGNYATCLKNESRGLVTSAVKPNHLADNILVQKVLSVDSNDHSITRSVIRVLSDELALRLSKRGHIANKLILEIYYSDGHSSSSLGSLQSNEINSSLIIVLNSLKKQIKDEIVLDLF